MKKLFTLLTLALISIGSAWGTDETLFTTNFSTTDGWSATNDLSSSGTITIKGTVISYKGAGQVSTVTVSDVDYRRLTFGSSNINNKTSVSDLNYYIAIPLTGVHGSLTVTTTGSATKWYYTYSDGSNGTCAERQQAAANNGFTITNLTNSNVTVYIGSKEKYMESITITTPELVDPSYTLGTSESPIEVQLGTDVELSNLVGVTNATFTDITSNNTSIATIDGTKIHPVALGNTTISFGNSESVIYNATNNNTLYINVIAAKIATTTAFSTPTTAVNVTGSVINTATVTNGPGSETITYSSSDETIAKVNASTGEVKGLRPGSATITATYAGNEDYDESSDTYDITVSNAALTTQGDKFWKFSDDIWEDFATIDKTTVVVDNLELIAGSSRTLSIVSASANASDGQSFTHELRFGGSSGNATERVIHFKAEANKMITVYGRAQGDSKTRKIHIAKGSYDSNVKNIDVSGKTAVSTYDYITTGSEETDIYIYGTESVCIEGIHIADPVATVPVTISKYEWATFCSDYALDFTGSDVKAYIVTGEDGDAITKEPVTSVAIGTPLLLNAPEGNYNITVAAEGTDYSERNKLQRGTGTLTKPSSGSAWVLGVESEKAMFQYIDGTPATVSTDKAYLLLESTTPTEARSLFLDDDVTGIKNIKVGSEDNIYYDLQGRRVLYPTKGLYIVNGKKVILK